MVWYTLGTGRRNVLLELSKQGITENNLSQKKWAGAEPNQEYGRSMEIAINLMARLVNTKVELSDLYYFYLLTN